MDERLAGLLAEGEALRVARLVKMQAAELERMEAEKARWGAVLEQALPLVHPALVPFHVDPYGRGVEAPDLQAGRFVYLFFDVPEVGSVGCALEYDYPWITNVEQGEGRFCVRSYFNGHDRVREYVKPEILGLLLLEMHEGWVKRKEYEERVSREEIPREWPMPVEFTDEQEEVIRELVVEASPEERIRKALGEIVVEIVADKVDRALRAAGLLDEGAGDGDLWDGEEVDDGNG